MALVTMAFRRSDVAATTALDGRSGFLVPPVDGRTIKASTFSSHKWNWVADSAPDLFVLRTSVGRYGEEDHIHREDGELVDVSLRDLAEATGLAAKPVDTEVTRWTGGLPQYPVGHLSRVARIRDEVVAARAAGLRSGLRRRRHPGVHRQRPPRRGRDRGRAHLRFRRRDHRHVDPGHGHTERGGTIAV